jgi:hypothetical protein
MNGLLESRVLGNLQARFGGGRMEKGSQDTLASRLPYKEQEQRHEVGLLKYLNGWAKLQEFPGRMVDWDADQVNQAYAEAVRKLQSISNGHAEAYEEALAN